MRSSTVVAWTVIGAGPPVKADTRPGGRVTTCRTTRTIAPPTTQVLISSRTKIERQKGRNQNVRRTISPSTTSDATRLIGRSFAGNFARLLARLIVHYSGTHPPLQEAAINFPTVLHEQTAVLTAGFFAAYPQVDTVLVVNSCARGQATPESDLDVAVLVAQTATPQDVQALEKLWNDFSASQGELAEFKRMGRFTNIHLDIVAGHYAPTVWDDGGGPDGFELEIGNHLAYSAPLGSPGPHFQLLRSVWLPYYDESLRRERLSMARNGCLYDLDHIPHFVGRGLYFQAFDRLYKAFQEFLQAVFIAHRTYPIAYNKWIREGVERWLGLPELYAELPPILEIKQLEGHELEHKSLALRGLLERWAAF